MSVLASFGLPLDISTHGHQIDFLINVLHVFMALLFVGWGIFLAMCLVRFRARPGLSAQHHLIKAKPSKYIEVVVIVFEAFLLIGLSAPVWAKYKNVRPAAEEALTVRVVAQQFAWNIHYSGPDGVFGETRVALVDEVSNPIGLDRESPGGKDDIVEINRMRLPVNKPIVVELLSKDVIHSFAIPLLRVKQDAIPGMNIPIWFTATQTTDAVRQSKKVTVDLQPPAEGGSRFLRKIYNHVAMQDYKAPDGTVVVKNQGALTAATVEALLAAGITQVEAAPRSPVEIQCAQLCGLGHYRMRGEVLLMPQADFDAWYAEAGAGADEEFFEEEFED